MSRPWTVAPLLLLCSGSALAQIPSGAAELERAEAAEARYDFDAAEQAYRQVLELAPGSRSARRARVRLDWLRARWTESAGYAPLVTLERARARALDREGAERLGAQVRSMPEGRARREALFVLGETWLRRLGDADRAARFYDQLADAPGADPGEVRLARLSAAEARAEAGDPDGALSDLERNGLGSSLAADEIRRAGASRIGLFIAAATLLLSLLLLGAASPWRAGWAAWRRMLRPAHLLVALFLLVPPAVLAELHEPGTSAPFVSFSVAVLPFLAAVAAARERMTSHHLARATRVAAAAGAGIGPVAIGYLVLHVHGGLGFVGL